MLPKASCVTEPRRDVLIVSLNRLSSSFICASFSPRVAVQTSSTRPLGVWRARSQASSPFAVGTTNNERGHGSLLHAMRVIGASEKLEYGYADASAPAADGVRLVRAADGGGEGDTDATSVVVADRPVEVLVAEPRFEILKR